MRLRCDGVLYVSGGTIESEDWAYQVSAECDGIPGCGFAEAFDDEVAWGITSNEMALIQGRHLAHSQI
jgi:hypothetical protein